MGEAVVEGKRVWFAEMPGMPRLQRGGRGHWSELRRHDRHWQNFLAWSLRAAGVRVPLLLPAVAITCTRYSRSEPDRDNLAASFKPLIDVLKPASKANPLGVGLILDDKPSVVRDQQYRWERTHEERGRVRIEIVEL